jgi:predicted transcriptional regulator of viral defense system
MEAKNTIADIVKSRINTFIEGYVFSYMDIEGASKNSEAIIKALNRLTEKGILHKLSKGKFYKPFLSDNGKYGLKLDEIIKDLWEHKGEQIGYLTGHSIFNKLRLTTQLSHTIQIA